GRIGGGHRADLAVAHAVGGRTAADGQERERRRRRSRLAPGRTEEGHQSRTGRRARRLTSGGPATVPSNGPTDGPTNGPTCASRGFPPGNARMRSRARRLSGSQSDGEVSRSSNG